jgi:hypothetical protein
MENVDSQTHNIHLQIKVTFFGKLSVAIISLYTELQNKCLHRSCGQDLFHNSYVNNSMYSLMVTMLRFPKHVAMVCKYMLCVCLHSI